MKKNYIKMISTILVVILLTNIFIFGLAGNMKVKAGLWSDHKGGIYTVIKGLVMLYIMNLIRENATGDDNEDLITSTIKKGLNLDEEESVNDNSDNNSADLNSNDNRTDNSKENETVSPADNNEESKVEIINEKSVNGVIKGREQAMVELVNNKRKEQGLQPLQVDEELVKLARIKARDMVENDYFAHQSPNYGSPFDMMKQKGVKYSLAGENLASARTVEKGFAELMKSQKHRANILEAKYDKIGVGIIEGGQFGLMIVQLFIDSPEFTS